MNAVRSNNVSLKYQRFTSSGYKVIGFTKIEFMAKSQFLSSEVESLQQKIQTVPEAYYNQMVPQFQIIS